MSSRPSRASKTAAMNAIKNCAKELNKFNDAGEPVSFRDKVYETHGLTHSSALYPSFETFRMITMADIDMMLNASAFKYNIFSVFPHHFRNVEKFWDALEVIMYINRNVIVDCTIMYRDTPEFNRALNFYRNFTPEAMKYIYDITLGSHFKLEELYSDCI